MSSKTLSRNLIVSALLPILLMTDPAQAGPWATQPIDDFAAAPFPESSPVGWVQTGLPFDNCFAGRRKITVNETREVTVSVPDLMYDSFLDIVALAVGPPAVFEEVVRLEYEFGVARDITGGGTYDRVRIDLKNISTSQLLVELGIKANTHPEVVTRERSFGNFGIPGFWNKVIEFPLSEFFPQINPTYVESITISLQTDTNNNAFFRVADIDLTGPVVIGEVDTDDGGQPTPSIHNAKYFEEWSWPDLPSPGPVTAMLDVELVEDDLATGGEYPGWLAWSDDADEETLRPGTVSHTTLSADAVNPYPDGTFEFLFRWANDGIGQRMFYPPDPIKVLSDKSLLLTVNSHHQTFETGHQTQLIHEVHVKIPEASPVIFSNAYEAQASGDEFSLHFEVVNVDPGAGAGPPVFIMKHTTDAAPYDVSTAAPQSMLEPLQLEAIPSVTGGRTRIALNQPLGFGSTVQIFDVRGRLVQRLDLPARQQQVVWNARDASGRRLASGVYFAMVEGAPQAVEKITLLR